MAVARDVVLLFHVFAANVDGHLALSCRCALDASADLGCSGVPGLRLEDPVTHDTAGDVTVRRWLAEAIASNCPACTLAFGHLMHFPAGR